MRLLIPLLFALSACSPVFKLATSQGNALDEKKLAQVSPGMTPEQVQYLLGTPLITDEFQPERWDYVSYYRSGEGKAHSRVVSLYFAQGQLERIVDSKADAPSAQTPEPRDET